MWGWRYLKSGEEVGGFVVGGEAEVGRGGVAVGAKGTLERQLVLHVLYWPSSYRYFCSS